MKNKTMKRILLSAAIMVLPFFAQAQCEGWTWPEDRSTAEEKNVLYTDALRSDNFVAAQKPHMWLLQNAPKLNTSIYIHGEKIYKGLIDQENNEERKDRLIDSLMWIYDARVTHCNEEADVMARKAYSAYRYNVRKRSELENVLKLFDEAYKLNGKKVDYYMHVPYMSVVVYNKKHLDNLSDLEILERYDRIMEVIDQNISEGGKYTDKLTEYKGTIDGMLVGVVDVNCDFVRQNLAPKFEENPTDLKLAKKIFSFMLNGKCTDDPLWLEAGKVIQEKEPSYGLAKNLGIKFKGSGDDAKAEEYFNMAIELADDPTKKAEMYTIMGSMKSGAAARDMYRKALSIDPTNKEAYSAIGNLYYNSFNQCKEEKDIVKDRAVFLAAYDMFQKAGDTKRMQAAQEQFPSTEEIFSYNYNKGDKITVNCWIGETTTIRSRD